MPKCDKCAWLEHLKDHCELEPGYPNGCDAFRPKQPPVWQGVLCVTAILSLQGFLVWLDNAPIDDLLVALVIIMAAFAAWVAYQITRRE